MAIDSGSDAALVQVGYTGLRTLHRLYRTVSAEPVGTGWVRMETGQVSPVVASTLRSISRTLVSEPAVPGPVALGSTSVSKAPTSLTEMIWPDSQVCPVFESVTVSGSTTAVTAVMPLGHPSPYLVLRPTAI